MSGAADKVCQIQDYSEFTFVILKVHAVNIQIEIRIHFYFFPVQSSSSRNVRHRNSRFSAALQNVHAHTTQVRTSNSTIIETTSEGHSTMFKVTLLVDSPFNSNVYYEDFSHREGEIGSGSHFLFKFSIFFRDLGIRYSVDLGSQNCSVVHTLNYEQNATFGGSPGTRATLVVLYSGTVEGHICHPRWGRHWGSSLNTHPSPSPPRPPVNPSPTRAIGPA